MTGRARDASPSLSHSREVVRLSQADQVALLEEAEEKGWTTRDLARVVKRRQRTKVIEGQADTMHTVEVMVSVDLEAKTTFAAEETAWALVKEALADVPHTKVISAHARPT